MIGARSASSPPAPTSARARLARAAPALALVAAVVLTLALQRTVAPDTFINGDQGLKALMVRQLAAGTLSADLRLPAPSWVRALWDDGFYPFKKPFVYRTAGRYYTRFPLPFLALSAIFRRPLGYRGLYVIPLVSTWLLFWSVRRAWADQGLPPPLTAALLLLLAFASPVTLYSALFWDHTLALVLAFHGTRLLLLQPDGRAPGPRAALAAGALVGLAGWFREELFFWGALLVGLAIVADRLGTWAPRGLAAARVRFVGAFTLAVAGFVAFNYWMYGKPLGWHVEYTIEGASVSRFGPILDALQVTEGEVLEYFPSVVFCAACLLPWFWRRNDAARRATLLFALCAAFAVVVPVVAHTHGGKEWGPRFLLIVFPLLSLVAGRLLQALADAPRGLRLAGIVCCALAALAGACVDSVRSFGEMKASYERRAEAVEDMRRRDAPYVVVSNQFVSQQMTELFGDKTFFLAVDAADLRGIAQGLGDHGVRRFLYVCYTSYPCGPLGENVDGHALKSRKQVVARFTSVATVDRYRLYDVSVEGER